MTITTHHQPYLYTVEALKSIPEMPASSYPSINNIDISPNGVFKILSELDPYKSPGPDAISGHLVNKLLLKLLRC